MDSRASSSSACASAAMAHAHTHARFPLFARSLKRFSLLAPCFSSFQPHSNVSRRAIGEQRTVGNLGSPGAAMWPKRCKLVIGKASPGDKATDPGSACGVAAVVRHLKGGLCLGVDDTAVIRHRVSLLATGAPRPCSWN
jgi:hypothetical protein